jgi:hypothetical protein
MIETGYQNKLMIKAANYDTYSKLAHINWFIKNSQNDYKYS